MLSLETLSHDKNDHCLRGKQTIVKINLVLIMNWVYKKKDISYVYFIIIVTGSQGQMLWKIHVVCEYDRRLG